MKKEIFLKALGVRVNKIRTRKEISKYKLAKDIGKPYQFILRLEQGKTNPSLIHLIEVAQGLGVDIEELVKRLP